jgi:hypothetical protein
MANKVRPVAAMMMCVTAAVLTHAQIVKTQTAPTQACKAGGQLIRLAELPEASGLVMSRTTPGRLWSHVDSGAPALIALDEKGKVLGRVSLSGATIVDWEAIASGTCGSGSCLYAADIGDNTGERKEITIYRFAEPTATTGTVKVDAIIRASYPDGGHDAEAFLAGPDGRLFIVTKGEKDDIALYRFPAELRPDATVKLERVGKALSKGKPAANERITDGAISPDGERVVLRTKSALIFYRASEFLNGDFKEIGRMDLTSLGEPQGEAVAFGSGDTVYIAGEGGGKGQAGTFGVLSCKR